MGGRKENPSELKIFTTSPHERDDSVRHLLAVLVPVLTIFASAHLVVVELARHEEQDVVDGVE